MGEKCPGILPKCRLHVTFRDLLHAIKLQRGTDGFTFPPKEGMLRIFFALKIRRLWLGVNPRTWVPKASTLPLDHQCPLICDLVSGNINCRNCSYVWNLSKLYIEFSAGLPLICSNLMQVNFLLWNHVERRTLLTIPWGGGHRSWDWTLEGHTFRYIYLKDKMVHIYACVMDKLVKPVLQVEYSACYSVLSY